jgi:hypothetical protein
VSYCLNLPSWSQIVGQWLYDWQTLIAGVIALAGALCTIKGIRQQLRQVDEHRRDEIRRRHAAARAALPIALASLSEVAAQIVNNAADQIESFEGSDWFGVLDGERSGFENKSFLPVSVPNEVISNITMFVETLNDEYEIRHIGELISSVQISIGRHNSYKYGWPIDLNTPYNLILDAAKVGLLVDTIYNYARFVDSGSFAIVDRIDPADAWGRLERKAYGLLFKRENLDRFLPMLNEIVNAYKEAGASPWNEKFT